MFGPFVSYDDVFFLADIAEHGLHAAQQGQEALIGGEPVCDASTDVSGKSLSVASPSSCSRYLYPRATIQRTFPISPRLNFTFCENLVSLHVGLILKYWLFCLICYLNRSFCWLFRELRYSHTPHPQLLHYAERERRNHRGVSTKAP
jgi:hypothetical protein